MMQKRRCLGGFDLVNRRSRAKDTGPVAGESDRHKTEKKSGPVCRHDAELTEHQLIETRTARWGRRKRAEETTGKRAFAA